MRIVYLAWGSLYWNPDTLPVENWKYSSLQLPLEFSRISDKGKGRLTLVIDEKKGTENNIWYGNSTEKNVNNAIKGLREREKTVVKNVGYINLRDGKKRNTNLSEKLLDRIVRWGESEEIDVIIWTDLKSNWYDIMGTEYSNKGAYEYFRNSELEIRLKILEYLYKATKLSLIRTSFSIYFFNTIRFTH